MFDYCVAAAEIADYVAEMAEMDSSNYIPSEEEMEEMFRYYEEEVA